MSRVGQISIARPGAPLQLEFDERALKSVIEEEAQAGDHVSLYPGTYTVWDEDIEIEIPAGVNITILPGAKVDYEAGFRDEEFSHDGDPVDSIDATGLENHPLAQSRNRYLRPNFTGHVENIVDMNFGSEWAFERDVEVLREEVGAIKNFDRFLEVGVKGKSTDPLELGFGNKIQFRSGDRTAITHDWIDPQKKEDIYVKFDFEELSGVVETASGGNKIQMRNAKTSGNVIIDHEETETLGSEKNEELTILQSVGTDDYGHLEEVQTKEIAVVERRKPRSDEGKDGDIWLVEEFKGIFDIYAATTGPDRLDGKNDDLWFVTQSENSVEPPGNIFANQGEPAASDGNPGDVWLEIEDGPEGSFTIQEVFFKQRSPSSSDGDNNDIWTTEEFTQ